MPDAAREQVGAALRRARTLAIVDETIAELASTGGRDAAPFAAYAPACDHRRQRQQVALGRPAHSAGSGRRGLRMDRLADARLTLDLGPPVLEQLVLLGCWSAATRSCSAARDAREARDALVPAVRGTCRAWRFQVPRGGLSLWCELPAGIDATAVAVAAEQEGLLLAAGPMFGVGRAGPFLRLPYALGPELPDAVERLARAVERVRAGGATGRGSSRGTARPLVA